MPALVDELKGVLHHYRDAFQAKQHSQSLQQPDVLMDVFGVTPRMKSENPQYWGRELGMCWERLVRMAASSLPATRPAPGMSGSQEPVDVLIGDFALDTKYRLGSGDSGTLGKLADNAGWLRAQGYEPVMLFLREDSLPSALTRMQRAGWHVLQDQQSFDFVELHTGVDLLDFLRTQRARA